MSLFDAIQQRVFATSLTVFGDTAVWVASNPPQTHTAKVLFNSPNDPITIGSQDKFSYRPFNYSIEYYVGEFPGLMESVKNNVIEVVTVNGISLAIREVFTKFDGKTIVAYGEPNE